MRTLNAKKSKEKQSLLQPGDVVYEVFTLNVKRAVVERVYPFRPVGKAQYIMVCEIICDDGSISPRYQVDDLGLFLFLTEEGAEEKAEKNREMVIEMFEAGHGNIHTFSRQRGTENDVTRTISALLAEQGN